VLLLEIIGYFILEKTLPLKKKRIFLSFDFIDFVGLKTRF